MSEKFISLECEPFLETTVEEIEQGLATDEKPATEIQALERIQKLSGELRFMVDENRKLRSSNVALARDRGDLVSRLLHVVREYTVMLEAVTKQANEVIRLRALTSEKEPCKDLFSSIIEDTAKRKFGYFSFYLHASQEYSTFRAGNPSRLPLSLAHFNDSAQSLAEEVHEFSKDSTREELGDVIWCIAAICDSLGFSFEELAEKADKNRHSDFTQVECTEMMEELSMIVLSHARKVHGRDHPLQKSIAWSNLTLILARIFDVCELNIWDVKKIMLENIDKNAKRYPSGKWTAEDSIKRVDQQCPDFFRKYGDE